jgi:uncharacterized iron-regulated membrane protein
LLVPRLRKTGRLKWRDVHAASGIIALTMLIVFITTGMPWSTYWGKAWSAVGSVVTPGKEVDAPSTLAKAGVMTTGVLLLLTSIGTSFVMWWNRRPSGRAGLPKRPMNPKLPLAMTAIGLVVAVVYPLWGLSALIVVVLDRFVIRRIRRLRSTFGLPPRRDTSSPA